jgi:CDP-glucose 4,6-dehydratase
VIGGGDWGADRLVPDCVRALSKGAEVFIRYPRATRPWQYVLEPLRGYLLLGAKLWTDSSRYVGAWNFGPSDEKTLTVEEVVKEIIRRWGQGSYRVDPGEHPHEDHWLKLDCAKAKSHLGWHLLYSVDEALTHIVKWYQNYYVGTSHRDMWDFTVKQINQYMAATE